MPVPPSAPVSTLPTPGHHHNCQLEEYQAAFRGVDAGGNGTISATELFHLFQKLDHPIRWAGGVL